MHDHIKLDPVKVSDGCRVISIMPSFFGTSNLEKTGEKKSSKEKGLYSYLAAVCLADERRTPQNKPKHFKDESVRQTLATKNVK